MATTETPRAEEPKQEPQLRCAKCEATCGQTVYCPSCYDGNDHEEPDGDEEAAAAFGRKALALLGSDLAHADEALAAVKRGAEAIEAQKLAAEVAARAAAEATRKAALDTIKAAMDSGRLEPGAVASLVPFLSDDDAAAALGEKLTEAAGDYAQTITALSAYDFTAADGRRISAYLGSKQPAVPSPRRMPNDTEGNHAEVARVRAAAEAGGARVYSIAAIAAAAKKENAR